MRDYFKPKTWFITILMFLITLGLSSAIVYYEFGIRQNVKISKASSSDNVTGWAWNSNIGWVSFNCTNDSPVPCEDSNYGVSIDPATGHFSGYAWSSSIGWISFNDINPPDSYAFNTNCATAGSCAAGGNCTACYNQADNKVYGWGKILTLGDNGWIKLSGSWANGVSVDPATGDFSGWAWNANTDKSGIGWLSFNCTNDSPACGSSNYKVTGDVNRPPSAIALNAPNWSFAEAAGVLGALNARLGWTFSDPDAGSSQSAYQIIVNTSDSTVTPLPIFDSEKCLGYQSCEPVATCDPNKCRVDNGLSGTTIFPLSSTDGLQYNTAYYWWIMVWDNNNVASTLAQYNSAQDTPLEADDGSPLTFTTYKHEFPEPGATKFPENPSRGEKVKFTDTSKIYLTGDPTTAVPYLGNCLSDPCALLWTLPDGALFDDSISGNDEATSTPTIIFNNAGSNSLTLRVTDNDGYYSSAPISVIVNAELPKWREVKPE